MSPHRKFVRHDRRTDLFASPNKNYWTQCQARPTECLRRKPSNVRFHCRIIHFSGAHENTPRLTPSVKRSSGKLHAISNAAVTSIKIKFGSRPKGIWNRSCTAVTLSPTATLKTVTPIRNPVASLTGKSDLSESGVQTGNFLRSNDFSLWHWLGIPPTP